jgi:hypothetical protein
MSFRHSGPPKKTGLARFGGVGRNPRTKAVSSQIQPPSKTRNQLVAGSSMLCAHMLLHKVHTLRSGDWILVHAAAGGLGQIVTHWAKRLTDPSSRRSRQLKNGLGSPGCGCESCTVRHARNTMAPQYRCDERCPHMGHDRHNNIRLPGLPQQPPSNYGHTQRARIAPLRC